TPNAPEKETHATPIHERKPRRVTPSPAAGGAGTGEGAALAFGSSGMTRIILHPTRRGTPENPSCPVRQPILAKPFSLSRASQRGEATSRAAPNGGGDLPSRARRASLRRRAEGSDEATRSRAWRAGPRRKFLADRMTVTRKSSSCVALSIPLGIFPASSGSSVGRQV